MAPLLLHIIFVEYFCRFVMFNGSPCVCSVYALIAQRSLLLVLSLYLCRRFAIYTHMRVGHSFELLMTNE